MSEELKPCPFCGGSNIIVSETDDESMSGFDAVECADCGCEIMGSTAAGWNTRALTPKQQCADEMYHEIEQDISWLEQMKSKFVLGSYEYRSICLRIESKQNLLSKARGEL